MWPINRGVLMCQLLCPSGTYYAEMMILNSPVQGVCMRRGTYFV